MSGNSNANNAHPAFLSRGVSASSTRSRLQLLEQHLVPPTRASTANGSICKACHCICAALAAHHAALRTVKPKGQDLNIHHKELQLFTAHSNFTLFFKVHCHEDNFDHYLNAQKLLSLLITSPFKQQTGKLIEPNLSDA